MAARNLPYGGKSVPMEPGERDKAVRLDQRSAPAAGGYPFSAWSVLASPVWMRRIDASARERQAAGGNAAAVTARWEMSYRADMDPELVDVPALRRVVYQGRVYEITGASLIGQRLGVELETIARTDVAP